MSHADSVSTVDVRSRRKALLAVWAEHPRAFLVAVALGILVSIGVIVLLRVLADTGDEPPIRVKNGSLELHLLYQNATWTNAGNHWKTSGTRRQDLLQLTVATRGKANCTAYTVSAIDLEITYADPSGNDLMKVDIKSTGNHSKVTPSQPMSASGSVLSYPTAGFIKSIVADGTTMCTFTTANQLDHLVILDF